MHTSLAANDYLITFVTRNHFQPGAYTNTTEMDSWFGKMSHNTTTGKNYDDIGYQTDSHDMQQFISMLEGGNGSTPNYEDLTPSECIRLYSTDFVSDRRNLFIPHHELYFQRHVQ